MKRIHIIVSLTLILLFTGCTKQTIMTWQKQYGLSIRHLNEGNYEEDINNVKNVLIATWDENISEWSQSKIKEQALWYANMWKKSGVHIDKERELPYFLNGSVKIFL